MKYCDGLDCMICDEKEPCIYKRANELQQCLDEIEDLCKIVKNSNTGFYTLCDVVMLKIKEVKGNE